MARRWKCQKCGASHPRTRQKCDCGRGRPVRRRPAHERVLEVPYEHWVARFGEKCGVCGKRPKGRRLDRDHCHKSGEARGLLCVPCNRALTSRIDANWLDSAAKYLRQPGLTPEEMTNDRKGK